jgi:hypothetical protein
MPCEYVSIHSNDLAEMFNQPAHLQGERTSVGDILVVTWAIDNLDVAQGRDRHDATNLSNRGHIKPNAQLTDDEERAKNARIGTRG